MVTQCLERLTKREVRHDVESYPIEPLDKINRLAIFNGFLMKFFDKGIDMALNDRLLLTKGSVGKGMG